MTDPELTKQPADSENYYRSLIHNLHEDIIVIDSNYTITDMNNSFLATVGRSAEDVIGHNCYEVSHGYDNPCDQYGQECPLRKVFDTGLPNRCRHTHTAKDGAKVYVDVMTAPIKDSGGNITHVVEAVRDITDLMEAQAQQHAS
ncbi:MAG: PAS domain S-box protein, partial [Planctomycetes bacterium]|nr:PAS domain S-box protein [Planctomycetota bacterium]